MAEPVIVVVDDDASLQAPARELASRYGADYRIVASGSAQHALARLELLRDEGASVPLIMADQWMPGMTGAEFLARARALGPEARRGLLISWGDQSATAPIVAAAALGQIDFYLPKPAWSPDEQFHRAVTESLEEWWRQQGGQFEAVTVIGDDQSAARGARAGETGRRWRVLRGGDRGGAGHGGEAGIRGGRRELGRAGRPAFVEVCRSGHDPDPLAVPGGEHVRLPDPPDSRRSQC
jgi:CheY-like chemotaxis protein